MSRRPASLLLLPLVWFLTFCALPAQAQTDEDGHGSRRIHYGSHSIVPLNAKLRYTTLIILPQEEQILDFLCGDKDYWQVSGVQNYAFVKPAKEGSETNVNLLTASGNVYSFIVKEISRKDAVPDLKVFVEPTDTAMLGSLQSPPKFVAAGELEQLRTQLTQVRTEARAEVEKTLATYPSTLRFDYRFKANDDPFYLQQVWHDGKNTYIRARASELPALYELRDGKPNLIQFTVQHGVYTVPKVLDQGYLTIGKHKTEFRRER
ncbi:MAG: TrbG/VirB9 family P-type conjugative transfer protein [Vicinamibacteraceae bacterium]